MKKLLIIEDDAFVSKIYRNKFTGEGYRVEIAPDGQSGFEQIKKFKPDLVILDLMLPRISGLDLLKKVRAEKGLETLPMIVFSNTYLSNLVQEAANAGATKCLSKVNCTPAQLIAQVRELVSPEESTATISELAQPEEAAFQTELRNSFVANLPSTLSALRASLQSVVKSEDEVSRLAHLNDLYRKVHALTGNAGIVGMKRIAQLADAFEALLREMFEKPENIHASTLRTAASAIDCLSVLFDPKHAADPVEQEPFNILVVDDEPISLRAVVTALEKAGLKAATVDNPSDALHLLAKDLFDLVFLDVDMPVMNGFELCTKLRALPNYKGVPVVFVTALNDFESRASSIVSGGNDLIAKPFLFTELAVKALIYVLRSRLEPPKR